MPPASSHPDAQRWDARYAEEGQAWLERPPRRLLQDFAGLLPRSGLALDAAAGVSNNGLFLAHRGLHVIALDISEVGLRLAVQRARRAGLPFDAAVWDLSHPWLPPDIFAAILNFRYLERATFPVYRQALQRGGLIFFETYYKTDPSLPDQEYYLDAGELLSAFRDFEILHWEETRVPAGLRHPERGVAKLAARRP